MILVTFLATIIHPLRMLQPVIFLIENNINYLQKKLSKKLQTRNSKLLLHFRIVIIKITKNVNSIQIVLAICLVR
jgi:hypothetical protein